MNNHADSADSLIDAGILAENRGDSAEAERLFGLAIATDPGSGRARMNLGIALHARMAFPAAQAAHADAVRLDPLLAPAHYNLALASMALEEHRRAEEGFRNAVRLQADFPEAWVGLAEVLEISGSNEEAIRALEIAVSQRAQYAGAAFNLGVLLRKLGRLDEAEARLRAVRDDHPDYANVLIALAATLRDQGRVEEAVDALRMALVRVPDSGVARGELLFTLGFSDRVSADGLFAEHFWAGCRFEYEAAPWCGHFENAPDPGRVLRIGYLSGDYCRHAVSLFIESLFERHKRDGFRIHAYSSTTQHDAMTERFIDLADVWRDIREMDDAQAAGQIISDRIDILVDLSGHTNNRRTGILAGRAAPLQMTWLGHINTTGFTRVDYRITDSVADPEGLTESLHTERLLRMPHSQWCFRPPSTAREIDPSRDPDMATFTFGSFNQFAKVSDTTLALWIDVLQLSPAARLRAVGVPRGSSARRIESRLAAAGISRARFDLIERVPLSDYYREYTRVDACIDTTPFSGGTTTCDALWMGVPVITLAGERSMSRSAASLLCAVGRPDLIAHSREAFLAIAAGLAIRGQIAVPERVELRRRMIDSALMDERRFAEDLEHLYRRAWGTWCKEGRSASAVNAAKIAES